MQLDDSLEIQFYRAINPKGTLIFWPGWMIDFKTFFYKIPIDKIVENNYSLVLYNPPGHGKSAGVFNVDQSLKGLFHFLQQNGLTHLPYMGVAHSAGCNCLLKFAAMNTHFQKIFLFSPIFDSRRSFEFMYENNTHHEFVKSLAPREPNKVQHLDILQDSRWTSDQYWNDMNYSTLLDYSITNKHDAFFQSISKILEETLFPGHTAWEELALLKSKVKVFIPFQDNWYPREELISKLASLKVDYDLLPQGSTHFLVDHWEDNWDTILKLIQF